MLVLYSESTNSSLLRKCAVWNFDGKCLPFTLIAELFCTYWKSLLWDGRSKQILPNIYGFRAEIIVKYENIDFFKRKWILMPYLS